MLSGFLRYFLQSYFTIALSVMFNLKASIQADDFGASTTVSIGMILFLIGFMVFSFTFLRKNRHRLNEKSIINKYGALYEPAWPDYKPTLMLSFYFCLRRLITAAIIVWISDNAYL